MANFDFTNNIRTEGDLTELRESMQTFGWVEHLPALADEHGKVLVGHRRITVATELGLPLVIKTLTFGTGDEADAKRMKLALASNLGHQPMTPDDRKRIAEYLYGEREWTMARIAEALGVSKATISGDLNCSTTEQLKPAVTPTNPKGAGRPKGSGKPPRPRMNEAITAEVAATKILDKKLNYRDAEKQTGFSNTVIRSAVAREEGRREAAANPLPVTPLPTTAQQKLDAELKRRLKQLEIQKFDMQEQIRKELLADWVQPLLTKHIEERARFERVIKARTGVMTRDTYKKILACLHPDRVTDLALRVKYQEAFVLFTDMEEILLDEKEHPTVFSTQARTVEELMAKKEQATAARRAKRAQSNGSSIREPAPSTGWSSTAAT